MIVHVSHHSHVYDCKLQFGECGKRYLRYIQVPRRLRPSAAPLARGLWAPGRFRRGPWLALGSGSLRPWPSWAQSSSAWGSRPLLSSGKVSGFPRGSWALEGPPKVGGHLITLLSGSQAGQKGLNPGCLRAPSGSPQADKTLA